MWSFSIDDTIDDTDAKDAEPVDERNLSCRKIHLSVSARIVMSCSTSTPLSALLMLKRHAPAIAASFDNGNWPGCCFAASTI